MIVDDILPHAMCGGSVVNVNNQPFSGMHCLSEGLDNRPESVNLEGGAENDHAIRIRAKIGSCKCANLFCQGVFFAIKDNVGLCVTSVPYPTKFFKREERRDYPEQTDRSASFPTLSALLILPDTFGTIRGIAVQQTLHLLIVVFA